MKILGIQFRYFGDAALMVPALRAIKEHFRDCALHVLVAEEVVPALEHLPWLTRVWGMPRTRGRVRAQAAWPMIRALRRERFDRSVDFGGNDRSAILSWLCGARERLGVVAPGGFLGRRFCYTQRAPLPALKQPEVRRNVEILSPWKVSEPSSLELEIHADPKLRAAAEQVLPSGRVLCHIAASQTKKEWPMRYWAELYQLGATAGFSFAFSTGPGAREQGLLADLKKYLPDAPVLPPNPDLAMFLALLERAEVFISNDTAPLHYAAGLGVPTIGLFGPTPAAQWAPLGKSHQVIQAQGCTCDGNTAVCLSERHCLAAIRPAEVFQCLQKLGSHVKA